MDESAIFADDFELIEPLNERELEILALLAEHRTNQEIADALFLSLNTVKWYAHQIYGKLEVANRREAVERASQLGLLAEPEPVAAPRPHNLPAQLTPFVGRQAELAELRRLLLDPGCRLLTITGPGGMGKTRLALEATSLLALDSKAPFDDGVFLALLADLNDTDAVTSAIADAVGFRFYQADNTPEEQLGQFLRQKSVLLVLDNFEHLIGEVTLHFLTNLLATASGVTVLATSRVRLNIQGEQVFPLHGLDVPERIQEGETTIAEASGVQLFWETARRAHPTFLLNPTTLSPVVDICRLVEGMPLAIELAAAWTALLEPAEILSEIRSGLDFLASDAANVPARQRSLPVVLDASWQLLSAAEREGVRKLSVFRGGFTGEAARQIAVVSSATLLGLVGKSWLQRAAGGRYRILDLLRQYGAEKLREDATEESAVRTRHSLFYYQWLAGLRTGLRGREQQASLDAIAMELENVRAACFWAAPQGLTEQLDGALPALGLYYRWQAGYVAGDRTFRRLGEDLETTTDAFGQHALAQVLTWRCAFRSLMGDRETALRLIDTTLALLASPALEKLETRDLQAHIELQLGYLDVIPRAARAKPHFAQSYELYEQRDDKIGMAYALVGLGRAARNLYQFEEAETDFRRAIRLHESVGNRLGYGDALTSLGSLAFWQRRFDESEHLLRRSLAMMPSTDQDNVAQALYWLARCYHDSGRLAEAAATMDECLALRRDLGMQLFVVLTTVRCGAIYRDMGAYEKARDYGEWVLAETRSGDYQPGVDQALTLLGSIDLLAGDAPRAYERLQEGIAAQRALTGTPGNVAHRAWLGLAARALGYREEAWRQLLNELGWALRSQLYLALLTALAGLALLLADDGEVEQAVALHALLLEHPYTAHAHWFSQIITPAITTAAAGLSAEQRSAAAERGRAQDVWEVAARLAGDLAKRG